MAQIVALHPVPFDDVWRVESWDELYSPFCSCYIIYIHVYKYMYICMCICIALLVLDFLHPVTVTTRIIAFFCWESQAKPEFATGGGESQYTIEILHMFSNWYIIVRESLTMKFTVTFVFGVFNQTNSDLWSCFCWWSWVAIPLCISMHAEIAKTVGDANDS